jgi:predicted CxxxxCH...CXXCH cytochrome family protein
MTRPRFSSLVALAAFGAALVLGGGACQTVDNGVMAHTAPETLPGFLKVGGTLTGRHAQIACEGCHAGEVAPFGPIEDNCLACHEADRKTPTHHADDRTCSGGGCHSVADLCWAYYEEGCQPWKVTDTGTIITTDTDTPTDTGTIDTYVPPTGNSCASAGCHGVDPVRDDAAPNSSSHNAHLRPTSNLWQPVAPLGCSTCHPSGNYDAGLGPEVATHQDGTKSVTLQGITVGTNPAPLYTAGTKTCSGTYCHGGSMADAPQDPVWDGGGAEAACGTCHVSPPVNMFDGNPSPVGHPGITNCGMCHTPTGSVSATSIASPTNHINGTIETN